MLMIPTRRRAVIAGLCAVLKPGRRQGDAGLDRLVRDWRSPDNSATIQRGRRFPARRFFAAHGVSGLSRPLNPTRREGG